MSGKGFKFANTRREKLPTANEDAVHALDEINIFSTRAATTETDSIEATDVVRRSQREERADIFACATESAEHRAAADAHKLMDSCSASRHDAVTDFCMPSEKRVVCENTIVRDLYVVASVRTGHPVVAVADARGAVIACGAVDGDVLTEGIAIADDGSSTVL